MAKLDEIYSKERALSTESKTAATDASNQLTDAGTSADKAQSALHWKAWQDSIRDDTKAFSKAKKLTDDQDHARTAAAKADDREVMQQINQAKSQIEATGSGTLKEEMHQFIHSVLDKHQELAGLQALLSGATATGFEQTNAKIQETNQNMDRIRKASRDNHQS